ncbi:hypothetical protein EMPG_12844 [Blastomyces silverae]|uniref:DUF6593 domain-containing protein n=1 Tax=Blastomyces silverae TaxID=2060906 RepID=A0A0H1BKF7_9EURO|nr:hypothetical protein EMPG_12844 [Blastomyces silverae]
MAYLPTPIRSVHVIKENSWTRRSYKITTPDDLSCLYTVDISDGTPQVTLTRHLQPIPHTRQASSISRLSGQFSLSGLLGQSRHQQQQQQQQTGQSSNDYVVGTANFHMTVSSKIGINLSTNQTITMKRPDSFSSKRSFESLTPLGTLEWKSGSGGSLVTSDLKLVDMSGRTVARYEKHSSLLSGRSDEITLLVPELDGFLDIVIITCMATIEYRRIEEEIVAEAAGGI